MKNISLVLNIVLALAVAVLYYLHFKTPETAATISASETQEEAEADFGTLASYLPGSGIYYINTDSLWKKYDLIKKSEEDLQLEKKKLEGQFQVKLNALEKDYMEFQDRAQRGMITSEEAQRKEAELMQRQQKLMELKEELTYQLVEKEQTMNEKIQKAIYDYLTKYRKNKDINFILGYSRGAGALLYGNDSLDITRDIVQGLNSENKTTDVQANKK
jgi:outer membrane protein